MYYKYSGRHYTTFYNFFNTPRDTLRKPGNEQKSIIIAGGREFDVRATHMTANRTFRRILYCTGT